MVINISKKSKTIKAKKMEQSFAKWNVTNNSGADHLVLIIPEKPKKEWDFTEPVARRKHSLHVNLTIYPNGIGKKLAKTNTGTERWEVRPISTATVWVVARPYLLLYDWKQHLIFLFSDSVAQPNHSQFPIMSIQFRSMFALLLFHMRNASIIIPNRESESTSFIVVSY